MRQRSNPLFTFGLMLVVLGGFGYFVWSNASPVAPPRAIIPTEAVPTQAANAWQEVLRSGFDGQGTPIPTVAIAGQQFSPPTLARDLLTPTLLVAGDLGGNAPQVFVSGATPTLPAPTLTPAALNPTVSGSDAPDNGGAVVDVPTIVARSTSPPSLAVPLARDPFGRDHYWLARPVAADATNYGLTYYEYGTNGPKDAPYPIHTGIDIPNPIGTTVRAAGDGVVIFATDPTDPEQTTFQNSPSYGKVVFILHDFGYRGQPIYTLYAHLAGTLVSKGDRVRTGDPIALTGNTGHASGPHVHFEVRVSQDTFGSTYNPDLWLAPYVGHGTIAGRVVGERGDFLDDVDVQLMSGGLVRDTTTTYVFRGSGSEVNPDPEWGENFVFSSVAVGRYRVQALINGETVFQIIDVLEGQTTGVELKPGGVGLPVNSVPTPTP